MTDDRIDHEVGVVDALIAFLRVRLAEVEAAARGGDGLRADTAPEDSPDMVTTLRESIRRYELACIERRSAAGSGLPQRRVADLELGAAALRVRHQAMAFADHPDHREEWRYVRAEDND